MENEMTTRAQEVIKEQNAPVNPAEEKAKKSKLAQKKKNADFKARVEVCKQYRRTLVGNWAVSVDYRRGKALASSGDDDQVVVPLDWPMTKAKQSALFSQVPKVSVSHPPLSASAGPWLASFETKLNDTLVAGGIETVMDELLPDVINAAGFGVALVSYETITEDKEVPSVDLSILPPEIQQKVLQTGKINGVEIPMETVPQVIDKRYVIQRLSPSDFLWPLDFVGSNFDNAPWLGRTGRITWAEAVQRFGLKEEDKDKVLGEDKTHLDRLTFDTEKDRIQPEEKVVFDEIFYKEHQYDPEAKSYVTIHHLVFINGKDEPVIDEPWKGQDVQEDLSVIGSLKYPLRVLTLSYITDDAIPPSDSAIGRGQVNEINKSRTQMIRQRERNIPWRWIDSNRSDPTIMQALMRGTWQNVIPVQGDGTRIIGEVAKAGHPQEDFTFDQIAKNDLNESWSIGPNQVGSGQGIETKGESQEISSNFQTRIGRERAKVAAYVVGIAEVLGGMLCLLEDPSTYGEGFDPAFSRSLSFSILVDSTLLLDSNQRLERLDRFLNTYAKSGFVNLEPVLREIAILTGLDPNAVIKAPDPQSPPPPNVSLRLSGKEDMMNPLMLAIYLGEGKPPTPDLIKQAMEMIQMSVSVPGMVQPGQPPTPGPDGQPLPPGPPTPVGEANPDLTVLPKIAKRSDDPAAGGKEGI
jgi:hypothetical protein